MIPTDVLVKGSMMKALPLLTWTGGFCSGTGHNRAEARLSDQAAIEDVVWIWSDLHCGNGFIFRALYGRIT